MFCVTEDVIDSETHRLLGRYISVPVTDHFSIAVLLTQTCTKATYAQMHPNRVQIDKLRSLHSVWPVSRDPSPRGTIVRQLLWRPERACNLNVTRCVQVPRRIATLHICCNNRLRSALSTSAFSAVGHHDPHQLKPAAAGAAGAARHVSNVSACSHTLQSCQPSQTRAAEELIPPCSTPCLLLHLILRPQPAPGRNSTHPSQHKGLHPALPATSADLHTEPT